MIKRAVEHRQPHCPECGDALYCEAQEWRIDCRAHLPWCSTCRKPVLAVFSVPQNIGVEIEPYAV